MLARSDKAKEPLLDRALSLMAPSFDGVEILLDEGPVTDFSQQRNRLIEQLERAGYDWVVMLDSDEAMFPADIAKVRELMTPERRLIVLPRHEFVEDFDHYDPTEYPDYQRRVFRLGVGYRFGRRVHEGLYRRFSPISETRLGHGTISEDTPIYHYGRVKTADAMQLKLYNYDLLAQGKPPLASLPDSLVVDPDARLYREIALFPGSHPYQGIDV
jgi:hypothetical protein